MAVTLTLDEVHDLAMRALLSGDISQANAEILADLVTAAERDACHSHGLFRVPGYAASAKSGRVDGHATPDVRDVAPGLVLVDAKRGFATPAMHAGRPLLVEKARTQGIAAMGLHTSHHFAALWPDIQPLAEDGLVAFAFVNSNSFVAPWGGTKPLYGTDPMAFACPRPGKPPVIFDQASSAMARGEIQIALRDGHPIPDGAGIDKDGNPTSDPAEVLAGAQLPFGGHKGSSIALMVEIMAAGLTNSNFAHEAAAEPRPDGGPANCGEFVIAIDPGRMYGEAGSAAFLERVEGLFGKVLEQEGTRLPSDRRYAARRRTPTEGVPVEAKLHATLVEMAGG
jgi:delta1-piperideine-2-carboxylate reductase